MTMTSSSMCYLNGEYLPLDEAKVSVLDRGFIFGDGVYEVIPVFNNKLFRINEHLTRLQNSLDAIKVSNPNTNNMWCDILNKLVSQHVDSELSVYIQVTRGVAPRDHAFPDAGNTTVFIMANPMQAVATDVIENGIEAITLDDIRWQFCNIKAISLLPNILLKQQAVEKGATEAILIRDGNVSEGTASNAFIVKNGVITTPPKTSMLLPGITRDLVVELAHQHNLPCEEKAITESELRLADEIWLTSSTKDIVAVTQLDKQQIGNRKPGEIYRKMLGLFQDFKKQLMTQ